MGLYLSFLSYLKDELLVDGEKRIPDNNESSCKVQKPEISSAVDPTIPYIDDDENNDEIISVGDITMNKSGNMDLTADDGGIILLQQESSIRFIGDHKFPSNKQTQIESERSSTGVKVKAKGHGGPGIVQLGRGCTVEYIATESMKHTEPEPELRLFKSFVIKYGKNIDNTEENLEMFAELRKRSDNILDLQFMKMIIDFGKSVGRIWTPTGPGTGFRVGDRYIMTAYHVVESFLPHNLMNPVPFLDSPDIHIIFQSDDTGKTSMMFTFHSILYKDEQLDVIVLELNLDNRTPPPPVSFCDVKSDVPFTFVGYDRGENQKCQPNCLVLNVTNHDIECATQFCIRNNLPRSGYEGLLDPNFIRFHCTFEKGDSGSPGVSVYGKSMFVCVMLLKEYPSFYCEPWFDKQSLFPDNFLLEEGVSMETVLYSMKEHDLEACKKVFPLAF